MAPTFEQFVIRANAVRAEVAAACAAVGRAAESVEILAVTKNHDAWAPEFAAKVGLTAVGENRVQEGVDKRARCEPLSRGLRWELIGHLQSNKARLAAAQFDRIQSVDSAKLIERLAAAAGDLRRTLPILLQVNAGNDPAKFGVDPDQASALLDAALQRPQLQVDGLMTIAPLSDNPAVAQRTFETLRTLRDELAQRFGIPLRELSMGMSGDLAAAIAAGSTQVRIGTALFGAR